MMLTSQFDRFHASIGLKPTRVKRITSAHKTLRAFVAADAPLSAVLHETFLQGSFQHSTAIRPQSGEFDVDVVLSMDVTEEFLGFRARKNPKKVVSWVAARLRTNPAYRGRVRIRKRCVRVNYAGGFHLDVLPAHCPRAKDDPLEAPDRVAEEWCPTHPKGFNAWCNQQNSRAAGRFTRVVKLMKWWRDTKLEDSIRPKSILLETLVGQSIPASPPSDAAAFAATLQAMSATLNDRFGLFSPTVQNPSLSEEDLARDWTATQFRTFRRRLSGAAEIAEQAIKDKNRSRSVRRWRELLGSTFPA